MKVYCVLLLLLVSACAGHESQNLPVATAVNVVHTHCSIKYEGKGSGNTVPDSLLHIVFESSFEEDTVTVSVRGNAVFSKVITTDASLGYAAGVTVKKSPSLTVGINNEPACAITGTQLYSFCYVSKFEGNVEMALNNTKHMYK